MGFGGGLGVEQHLSKSSDWGLHIIMENSKIGEDEAGFNKIFIIEVIEGFTVNSFPSIHGIGEESRMRLNITLRKGGSNLRSPGDLLPLPSCNGIWLCKEKMS